MTDLCFRDTLEDPDTTSAAASSARMEQALALGDDCLSQALDAAETIQPRNSLERMLAHQMAALHAMSMKALAVGSSMIEGNALKQPNTVEGCRLMNTAARMMREFQNGLATLAKIRTGGRQVVTVQHVNVEDGGQAVVAGQVAGGSQRGRKDEK